MQRHHSKQHSDQCQPGLSRAAAAAAVQMVEGTKTLVRHLLPLTLTSRLVLVMTHDYVDPQKVDPGHDDGDPQQVDHDHDDPHQQVDCGGVI